MKEEIDKICIELFPDCSEILKKCEISPVSQKFEDKFELSLNYGMIIASHLRQNPSELSKKIVNEIEKSYLINQIEIIEMVGAFINIKMKKEYWQNFLLNILKNENYGFENLGNGEKINIEFCSANPTGPIHIGHTRGTILGDVIANLHEKCGFDVTREYYINDAGRQIENLEKSIEFRINQIKNNDFSEKIPEGYYPGEYIIECAKNLIEKNLEINRENIIKWMLELIKETLLKMKIKHDVFTSEYKLKIDGVIEKSEQKLNDNNMLYRGFLEKPKYLDEIDEYEPVELLLIKTKQFGDDSDRPLRKRNGDWAYIAPDIAYHYDKFQRGFKKMILVLGSDHKGYVKRLKSAVSAISNNKATIDIKLSELVNFIKNGEQVKMSKRAGNFLTADDVLEEIDIDILRFTMLTKKSDTVINFDLEKAKEQSKDNPIWYIQYAHTRCGSLMKKALEDNEIDIQNYPDIEKFISFIKHPMQIRIINKISQFPSTIKYTCLNSEPHILANYLIDFVSLFHSMWNLEDFRFISEDKKQTIANLIFVSAIKKIISNSLNIFGIVAIEKM